MSIEQVSYYANVVSLALVLVLWFAFGAAFVISRKGSSSPDAKRLSGSWLGLILQGAGFAAVWSFHRSPLGSPIFGEMYALNVGVQILAVTIAAVSVWMAVSAVRELGRQWSLAARLVTDHKLIKTGVYGIVRHPIYTAMLGMLISTGLVFSHWAAIAAGLAIFLIGTRIRTVREESLLNGAFGAEYQEWRKRVPGLIPFLNF